MTRSRKPLTEEQRAAEAEKAKARYHSLPEEHKKAIIDKATKRNKNLTETQKLKRKEQHIRYRLKKSGKYTSAEIEERVVYLMSRKLTKHMTPEELSNHKLEVRQRTLRKAQKIVKDIKSSSRCAICNESDPCTLDFHHTDPTEKDMAVGALVSYKNIKRLEEEIAKCIILCANCHRKMHAGTLNLPTVRIEEGVLS